MLLHVWLSAFLLANDPAVAQATPPPAAATGNAAAMLKEKVAKLASLKSYTFEALDDGAGIGRGSRGGRGSGGAGGGGDAGAGAGAAPPAPTPTVGMVEIGTGEQLTRGESMAYRRAGKLVYKKGDAWELYVAPDFSGGGRGGGGAPAGGGGPPGGGAGGAGGGDRSAMREAFAMMGLANQVLPHDLIQSLMGKVKDATCATAADGGCTISGALTDEGADEFSGAKRMREAFAGGGFGGGAPGGGLLGGGGGVAGGTVAAGGGPAPAVPTGTASITFDAAGMPAQIVIETTSTGFRGESKRKQTYTMKAFDATKVVIPADATAKFGS